MAELLFLGCASVSSQSPLRNASSESLRRPLQSTSRQPTAVSSNNVYALSPGRSSKFDVSSAKAFFGNISFAFIAQTATRRSSFSVTCQSDNRPISEERTGKNEIVMKFGGSSVMNAERIKEVAELMKAHLKYQPVLVLSAMGKTTNNLLAAGDKALEDGIVDIDAVRELHYKTCEELDISTEDIEPLLDELQKLLTGISLIKELSPKTRDYLVSFGERMSVRVFARYMNDKVGVPAVFIDAFDLGMRTTDDYMNAEVDPVTYPLIKKNMEERRASGDMRLPVVTGFIGKDQGGNITTLGRGGSDLTASVIGAALGVKEIQVWKDVDGIMTTDPRIVKAAQPVPSVSFEEAAELAYFGANILHPLAIIPAMRSDLPVRVKNSYDALHPGTLIVRERHFGDRLLTAMTMKRNVTVVDIFSTRMLGQSGFLAEVFDVFRKNGVSVDVVATSEVSISLTLDQKQAAKHLDVIVPELEKWSTVEVHSGKSMISLVGNVARSSEILRMVFETLSENDIRVEMMSQGASKVNISFCVDDELAVKCVNELHSKFFPSVVAAAHPEAVSA